MSIDQIVRARQSGEAVTIAHLSRPAGLGTSGFYNPEDPGQPYRVTLNRVVSGDVELFELCEPLGYWDAHVGGVVVPANPEIFRTDLTSVPMWFTWLVPRTGKHLPAALVHDGLVAGQHEPRTYIASRRIDRALADRIFRDAMRDLGISVLRRWLMWTAVATASMVKQGTVFERLRGWLALLVTMGTVIVFGTAATIDLLDLRSLLPWMGDRPTWLELVNAVAAAILIPLALSPLWGRRRRAGTIGGIAIAFLFHVTVAIALVASLFQAVDALIDHRPGVAMASGAVATALIATVVAVGIWATV